MRRAVVLVALLMIPTALALDPIFPGAPGVALEIADEGRVRAASTHSYDDWTRSFSLEVEWSRIGVYDLARQEGVEAFGGVGEEFSEAYGTLTIELDDQGVDSSLRCTLSHNETRAAFASMFVLDGTLAITSGRGVLDDDAWSCVGGGNMITHGGATDIPLSSFGFAAAEGLRDGTFPAPLAVALGLVESEEEWAAEEDKEAFFEDVLEAGYLEAEPQVGEQRVPVTRSYDIEDPGTSGLHACGDAGVTDTPSTSATCTLEGSATVKIATLASAPAASAGPSRSGNGDAATKDAPGAPLALLGLCMAGCALAGRRRA